MKNKYEIETSDLEGIPFVKVWGADFCQEDLYELIGRNQFMATFMFKPATDAWNRFGQAVTGLIFYAKDETEAYEKLHKEGEKPEEARIKIDCPMSNLTQAQREDLKYGGLLVTDIANISFICYRKDEGSYETGEKVVPNVINIPFEADPTLDCDLLYQGYIVSKINSKTELIPFEKEKFIGITLGINNGHIDSRILYSLGYDLEAIRNSSNIWYYAYKTKERKNQISEEEQSRLSEIKATRFLQNTIKLYDEIKKSGVNSKGLSRNNSVFKMIMSSLGDFEPSVLLHGKKQVFWDADSYLHIVLRHVKQHQVGHFKSKTAFPYRFEDLQVLIEQVLGRVENEIKKHFEETPEKDFVRHGRMSVLFNGDYYCLSIDKKGRLLTLYINERKGQVAPVDRPKSSSG
jgi:hypothetical protein